MFNILSVAFEGLQKAMEQRNNAVEEIHISPSLKGILNFPSPPSHINFASNLLFWEELGRAQEGPKHP